MLLQPKAPAWRVLCEAAKDAGNVSGGEPKTGEAGKTTDAGAEDKDPEDLTGLKSALAKTKVERNTLREQAKAANAELETVRKAKADQDLAEKQAEEARLLEAGKFEELSKAQKTELEKLTGQIAELKDAKTARDKAEAVINAHLEARKKSMALPDAINALLAKLDPYEQLAWLDKNGESVSGGNGKHDAAPGGKVGSSELTPEEKRARSVSMASLG
uniref:Capsid protein n=1 Tax=viral metagenome TaxID=1070528 RepID=A0A6M3L7D4_9ZZZZ